MTQDIFYEYEDSQFGDGVVLNEYRNEFSFVAAKQKDGKTFMEWMYPQKKDGSKQPIDKSLPWKIKLGSKEEAIRLLKFFLEKLEGGPSASVEAPKQTRRNDAPPEDYDDAPF
ncbi:MAG: hypothetical protein MUP26_01360 [Desulfobulbaceae bacterium]|nr:hypothetical protein [Desulfobulbaceae bacterium]